MIPKSGNRFSDKIMRRKESHALNNIEIHYGAAQALRGISLKAEPGKVTCVLGRNGVGKTSLLRALVGQRAVSAGSIMFEGKDITRLSTVERARRGIAYVPQGREIFPLLTVEENLETGFRAAAARPAHACRTTCSRCFRCSTACSAGAAATSPAASSSNWRSAARW